MIVVKLREAMEAYRYRTGERMTYEKLTELTGISAGTLESIGSRLDYHPTWENVEKLCRALDVPLHDMLEMMDDPPKPERKPKKTRSRGKGRK